MAGNTGETETNHLPPGTIPGIGGLVRMPMTPPLAGQSIRISDPTAEYFQMDWYTPSDGEITPVPEIGLAATSVQEAAEELQEEINDNTITNSPSARLTMALQ